MLTERLGGGDSAMVMDVQDAPWTRTAAAEDEIGPRAHGLYAMTSISIFVLIMFFEWIVERAGLF